MESAALTERLRIPRFLALSNGLDPPEAAPGPRPSAVLCSFGPADSAGNARLSPSGTTLFDLDFCAHFFCQSFNRFTFDDAVDQFSGGVNQTFAGFSAGP